MPTMQETAYPRLKSQLSPQDLAAIYTPTPDELALAERATRGAGAYLGFLLLLKTFQRLGYFVPTHSLPPALVDHLAQLTQTTAVRGELADYDRSRTRIRHRNLIRQTLQVQSYSKEARHAMLVAMREAARTKEELADLINVGLEELVRQKYELPAFDTLVRGARHVRSVLYHHFYQQVDTRLSPEEKARLQTLFDPEPSSHFTPWNQLKQEPGRPTLTQLKVWLDRHAWLASYRLGSAALEDLPEAKSQHFAAEARTLDAARMLEMEPRKRRTLAVSLLQVQSARLLDDLAEMLIKRLSALHTRGREALAAYQLRHQQRTDELIATLRDVVAVYRTPGTTQEKWAAMEALLPNQGEAILQHCQDHLAHAGDNYLPFLGRFYNSHRATLFRLLRTLPLQATTQDTTFEEALRFLLEHEHQTGEWLVVPEDTHLALSWMPDAWRPLVLPPGHAEQTPLRLHRRSFELSVFSHVVTELKSGDVCIPGSNHFSDYRDQLLSWEDYHRGIAAYGEMVGLPTEGAALVAHLKARLTTVAQQTDRAFPDNAHLHLDNGQPILRRPEKVAIPVGLRAFEQLIAERLKPTHLLEVLRDTEYWLHWTRFFGPISGYEAKLDEPIARYLATTFCYGCQLGPTQTARSLSSIDRRQLSWVHGRHISPEGLDQAVRQLINAYQRFALPQRWGTGKSASVDGTKWDLYEHNLLAEYHIRYGGYGGIGYYHVSDTYIALFSHFIPCGVWEAVYLLDGLLKNRSYIRPDTLHGDTQAQSTPVFGLAALLGITLMLRIRNWQQLNFYRPDPNLSFTHIDALFSESIDWVLIQTHLPDM
ncbi:MAG: Tn3 family transposase, partial [Chloroflexi bacterium]|nr:Tn3 family transposase [Chloroflexota bacterium]